MRDKTVRLDGGESKQVTFSFVVSNVGEHIVHIVGVWSGGNATLSDKIAVLGSDLPWNLILLSISIIVGVFAIIMVVRRKSHKKTVKNR
jgi:hypothetical protein